MGIRAWYDTWCDEDDCLQWATGGRSRDIAAEAAREAGWRSRGGKWYCPDHTPTAKIMRRSAQAG